MSMKHQKLFRIFFFLYTVLKEKILGYGKTGHRLFQDTGLPAMTFGHLSH